jgi:hypothetical protein
MTYARQNTIEEQREATRQVRRLASLCKELYITLDAVDCQQYGMRAPVSVQGIEIASLIDLYQREPADILRMVRIKRLERAALAAAARQPGTKALVWSPVETSGQQDFLSLWVISLETNERVAIAEYVRDGERVYEPYALDRDNEQQLAALFGPTTEGTYRRGERVTIKVRDHEYSGVVLHICAGSRAPTQRTYGSRNSGPLQANSNEASAKYIVDCGDGFPHIVQQAQVSRETAE